jgi:hypothetical protein
MGKHPNEYELRRIRQTERVLSAVALATIVLIGVLAVRGNFKPPVRSAASLQQQRH